MAEKKTPVEKIEKEYVIPLRRKWAKVPKYKRANKAIKTIKEFLARHMKIRDRDLNKIKLDKYLNEFVWFRGIKKPPIKIKVKVIQEGEIIKAELAELAEKLKFKKARLDKREEKASEVIKKKKKEEKAEEPEKTEEEEEKKKEAEEKKAAVVEAGKELAKKAAKTTKHQTKVSKQPKRQRRQALAK